MAIRRLLMKRRNYVIPIGQRLFQENQGLLSRIWWWFVRFWS